MQTAAQVDGPACVSIGIFAWNEEKAIAVTLESLFQQSFFPRLAARGQRCEVVCVLNGCTDKTPFVAAEVFARQVRENPAARACASRVVNLVQRGKINAWNQFVHRFSAPEAEVLIMMDADIIIHRPHTVWNMFQVLEQDGEAAVAVDLPRKDILARPNQSLLHRISRGMGQMTQAAEAQLCGQLYAIRARTARRIYIPLDLAACEDGFLKTMVCTDLLAHEVWPGRIRLAPDAEHTFEAYTSLGAILRNQKRQIIGQTIVHLLVDKYLGGWALEQRRNMAPLLRVRDETDRDWLKVQISEHLRRTRFFWRLYPNLLGQHFRRLARISGPRKLACLPAAIAGWLTSLVCSYVAFQSLKKGCVNYWPKATRAGLGHLSASIPTQAHSGANR